MRNADTTVILNYARECATVTQDDCTFDEIQEALERTDTQNADLYLIDSGDDNAVVTDEQREAFGAEYRRELLELTLY